MHNPLVIITMFQLAWVSGLPKGRGGDNGGGGRRGGGGEEERNFRNPSIIDMNCSY